MATPTLALIPTGYKAGKLYSVLPESGVGDFTVVRATEATRVNEEGLIETMGANVPRLDYSGGGCPVLLTEGQRTNLFPYSSDYNQTDWTKINITIESNSTISPDGTLNADKILEQVDSANGHFMFDNLGLSINTEYNFSIFVKKLNRRYVAIQNSYNAANGSIAFFDLDTESLVYTYSAGTVGTFIVSDAKIEKYPNGWYRLSATFESDAAGGVLPSLVLANSQWSTGFSYNNLYTGDVTKGIYAWGAQVESNASYPTSYIKSEGSAVTRNGDQVYGAGDAATFNDSEGVLYAEFSALSNDGTFRILSLSNGTTSNEVKIQLSSTDNTIGFGVVAGGVPQTDQFYTIADTLSNNKIAAKYKENDFALWVNGIEVLTDSSGIIPTGLSTLNFERGTGSNPFYGNTKQIQYFNTALTDSELEKLTSWASFIEMAQAQNYNII